MTFRPRIRKTQTLFSLGMFSLVMSNVLHHILQQSHPDLADGVMGVFMGIAIATLIGAIRLKARGRESC